MTTRLFRILTATAVAAGLAAGCSDAPGVTSPDGEALLARGGNGNGNQKGNGNGRGNNAVGAVYTMSNATGSNEVIVLNRASDETLSEAARVATGGAGTGESVGGSQDGIELSENGRFLLVVNAGSDELSVFAVRKGGLRLTDTEPSGGETPVSITVNKDLIYVLNNEGGVGSITGFRLSNDGSLTPIPGSTRALSGVGGPIPALPAQVGFSPRGDVLVVTERFSGADGGGRISTYTVRSDGSLSTTPIVTDPPGRTPFGFDFGKRNHLIVSEAFVTSPGNAIPGASAASSFTLARDGTLTVNPGGASVRTFQTVACWVDVSQNGRFAYVTNTASGNITGYRIGNDGSLTRLDADGITALTGPGPVDLEFSRNGQFLYVTNIGDGSISAFKASPSDGSLTPIAGVEGLPASLFGIAAS